MLINVIMVEQHRVGHRVHGVNRVFFIVAVTRGLSTQDTSEQVLLEVWHKILWKVDKYCAQNAQ